MTILITLLAIAGCGTNSGFAGKQSKNGAPIRIERLGTMTTTDLVEERACNSRQIRWCSASRAGPQSCECVYLKRAEDRVRRMTGQTGLRPTPQ